jgi:integrase
MLWMQKNAYEPSTIRKVAKLLRHLQKNCNALDPENVKLYVSKKQCGNGHKENLIEAYAIYLKSRNTQWEQPFYQRYDKKRRAPKERLIDFIIQHSRLEMALKLSMMKDLGTRPIELTWLTLKDIDLATGIVSLTGAKHTIGREGKLKQRTLDLLRIYIARKHPSLTARIVNMNSDNFSVRYRWTRNRIANDYNMPELKQIQLYDFRRFKASKEYHLTHNLLLVKQILGHKDTRTTEKYISLFDEQNITWIPVICTTDAEIQQAIKDDCILVCQADGKTYFKKPA